MMISMAVMSRVLWSTSLEETTPDRALELARNAVACWALDSPNQSLEAGTTELVTRNGLVRKVKTVLSQEPQGFLVELEDQDGQAVWGVSIRAAVLDERLCFWVENTMEASILHQPVSVGRPRVVDQLLTIGKHPRLGSSGLLTSVEDVAAGAVSVLVEYLQDERRMLPVVVVSCTWSGFDGHATARSEAMARRLTGLATVIRVDPAAQDALKDALPNRLGVWGGAVRVYAPGRIESAAGNRLFSRDLLGQRGIDPVVNWVTSMSTRRRPDPRLRAMSDQQVASDNVSNREIVALRAQLEELEVQLGVEQLERDDVETQLNEALGQLRRLRNLGFTMGRGDDVVAAEVPAADEPDDTVGSLSDAVIQAQLALSDNLAIPESALQELDRLDATPNATAWGNSLWRGLLALSDYAREATQEGSETKGFWSWCEGGTGTWPATAKKLAMRESESVAKNAKWKSARYFKVDPLVDSSGSLYMEAHLKISEGGGDLAPRVYFHDDTKGKTAKVHIGFIGPHYLVPNTKS